jgi:hypothetical protein
VKRAPTDGAGRTDIAMTAGEAPDLVAFVTNASFPGRRGVVGDYLELDRFKVSHPELSVRVIEFNDPDTDVEWDGDSFRLTHPAYGTVDVGGARLVLYMPVSFEPEDVALRSHGGSGAEAFFADRQWRVVSEFLEAFLANHANCINNPRQARSACNKLIQLQRLREAGFATLPVRVAETTPANGAGLLVRKNLSEGAIVSSGVISSARLIGAPGERLSRPAIFQPYVQSDHEMRFYVLGTEIIPVRLRRRMPEGVVDVREMQATMDDVSIAWDYEHHHAKMLEACRLLGLRYAVIDAIPKNSEPHILEVNPNGVWSNLPRPFAEQVASQFHKFLHESVVQRAL